jgi:hypothetical protein
LLCRYPSGTSAIAVDPRLRCVRRWIVSSNGEQVQITGTDPAEIKGWMTI